MIYASNAKPAKAVCGINTQHLRLQKRARTRSCPLVKAQQKRALARFNAEFGETASAEWLWRLANCRGGV
jgi:hypothetical protein